MRYWLVALLLTTSAQAHTWVAYARTPDNQVYSYSTDITHYQLYGTVLRVWTQSNQTTARYDIHCASGSLRLLQQLTTTESSTINLTRPDTRWESAIPDTVEAALVTHICSQYK